MGPMAAAHKFTHAHHAHPAAKTEHNVLGRNIIVLGPLLNRLADLLNAVFQVRARLALKGIKLGLNRGLFGDYLIRLVLGQFAVLDRLIDAISEILLELGLHFGFLLIYHLLNVAWVKVESLGDRVDEIVHEIQLVRSRG